MFVHSAASIYFTEHVHDLIRMNYVATRNVLELADGVCGGGGAGGGGSEAASAVSSSSSAAAAAATTTSPAPPPPATPTLSAFIHVSTAYVNANRPAGTRVKEMIYSLVDEGNRIDRRTRRRLGLEAEREEEEQGGGGVSSSFSSSSSSSSSSKKAAPLVIDHGTLMSSLLAIEDRGAAAKLAQKVVDALGFPNAYTLSNNCCEKLVADWHEGRVSSSAAAKNNKTSPASPPSALAGKIAIVRPTIIGPIGDGVHRGYFGNGAGITSLVLAFATGVRLSFLSFEFFFSRSRSKEKRQKKTHFFPSLLLLLLPFFSTSKQQPGGRPRRLEPHLALRLCPLRQRRQRRPGGGGGGRCYRCRDELDGLFSFFFFFLLFLICDPPGLRNLDPGAPRVDVDQQPGHVL